MGDTVFLKYHLYGKSIKLMVVINMCVHDYECEERICCINEQPFLCIQVNECVWPVNSY